MNDLKHTDPVTPAFDRDLNVRGIVGFGVAIILAIVVSGAVMWWISTELRQERASSDPEQSVIPEARAAYEPPGPRLQVHPEDELKALRAAEEEVLTSYKWVDEPGGVAQIPVHRAIAILAAEVASAPPVGEDLAPSLDESGTEDQTVGEGLAPSLDESGAEDQTVGEGLAPSLDESGTETVTQQGAEVVPPAAEGDSQ